MKVTSAHVKKTKNQQQKTSDKSDCPTNFAKTGLENLDYQFSIWASDRKCLLTLKKKIQACLTVQH
jgi:hypothetical protein